MMGIKDTAKTDHRLFFLLLCDKPGKVKKLEQETKSQGIQQLMSSKTANPSEGSSHEPCFQEHQI